MKKLPLVSLILIFCWLFCPLSLKAENSTSLVYSAGEHLLQFDKKMVPTWIETLISLENPDTQYSFVHIFSSEYAARGWFPITKKADMKKILNQESTFKIPKKSLERGWFYSKDTVASPPTKGWYFSPKYFLFFNQDGLFQLDRFFTKHLDDIKLIKEDSPNKVAVHQMIRIEIQNRRNIQKIKMELPYNWLCAYHTIRLIGAGQHQYVLLPFKEISSKSEDPQVLKAVLFYKNGGEKTITYKVFFDLQSQLISL